MKTQFMRLRREALGRERERRPKENLAWGNWYLESVKEPELILEAGRLWKKSRFC